eukprot:m.414963 g.414963  ORF g.414963 m.414963 type:complete len:50 (-) comp29477_c0_seq1:9-158(-)
MPRFETAPYAWHCVHTADLCVPTHPPAHCHPLWTSCHVTYVTDPARKDA